MIHSLSVVSYQRLRQVVTPRPYRVTVAQKVTISQSVTHNIRTRAVSNKLNLTQGVSYRRSIANLSVGHTLNLYSLPAKNPIYLSVEHAFYIFQMIKQPLTGSVSQSLSLVQAVVGHGAKGVPATLSLSQVVSYSVVRNVTIAQTLSLVNGVSAWLQNPDFNYLNPVFTVNAKVRFRFNSQDFLIRKPDFDDTYGYEFTRINRRSRGGDLIISRDSMWPMNKTFRITFTYLSQDDIDKLLNLCRISLGRKIQYLNYDNVEWEGYITNPQTPGTQLARGNHSFTIEFQGEPV